MGQGGVVSGLPSHLDPRYSEGRLGVRSYSAGGAISRRYGKVNRPELWPSAQVGWKA